MTVHRLSRKSGLPPGTLVHVGEERTQPVTVSAFVYNEQEVAEYPQIEVGEAGSYRKHGQVCWINTSGVHDPAVISDLGRQFGIHPLTLEDILNTGQRSKAEMYDTYLYLVFRMLSRVGDTGDIRSEQVSLILGDTWLLSFQEDPGDVFDTVRNRIRTNTGFVRNNGADYLAYALLDAVVDNYFLVLEAIEEKVDALEQKLVEDGAPGQPLELHELRRELLEVRRAVWPLRDAVTVLERGDSPLVSVQTRLFFRDVHDHAVNVIDTVETLRDVANGLLDLHLSSVSNRTNEIMKTLTIFAAIFIPLTFMAGVYGMNFRNMPELGWQWGYPFALGMMTLVAGGLLVYFRRRGWL